MGHREVVMRSLAPLAKLLVPLLASLLVATLGACGGRVVFDGVASEGGAGGAPGPLCVLGGCGDECSVCADGECAQGSCDAEGVCVEGLVEPSCP
jgi:hypothetical protein